MRFRESDEFGPTLDVVAEHLDIGATAVEKDYWVSEVLRVLVANVPDDFIFKGGTSLSKGTGSSSGSPKTSTSSSCQEIAGEARSTS